MTDLDSYIAKRKTASPEFVRHFDQDYEAFKFGVLLKEARIDAGLTQAELAHRMNTQKSAISRVENHAGDIKLLTLENFASALGKKLELKIV